MDEAKFITLDNCLTILIYTDRSKSTNHMELFTFYGGNYSSYIDYNGKREILKRVVLIYLNIMFVRILFLVIY